MKLGVSMWSVVAAVKDGRIDLPGFIEFVARQQENGATGVELLDYFWRDQAAEQPAARRQIADAGLELLAYSISNDFFHPDAEARAGELAGVKRGVDTAAALGVGLLRVFSGNAKPGYSLEDGLGWILEGLAAGAEYGGQHGVVLALENHGQIAGRSSQVRHIIETVNSPFLRANLDTGNFLTVGQDATEAAREVAPLAALVHLKDFRKAVTPEDQAHAYHGWVGCVTGEGEVDLPAVINILRDSGYGGWLSLEFEGTADPLTVGVPKSLQAAQRLLG